MKTILAITHLESDIQIEEVATDGKKRGLRVIPICTNTVSFENIAIAQRAQKINLLIDGKTIRPSSIWFATYPREDTLFHSRMSRYVYPGEYRSAVAQFMADLRFAFEGLSFFPGTFDHIQRADSKLSLFRRAHQIGIQVPSLTINSNLKTKKQIEKNRLYRKKLGFPSIVSYSRSSNQEEIITTTNGLTTKDSCCVLWQWQSPIESIAHIRGVMIDDRCWFVKWKRESKDVSLVDLRDVNQNADVWSETRVPDSLLIKLNHLRSSLGLRMCCPEFLLTPSGKWVLIDLNPCGDWHGFFSELRRKEIVQGITSLFQK